MVNVSGVTGSHRPLLRPDAEALLRLLPTTATTTTAAATVSPVPEISAARQISGWAVPLTAAYQVCLISGDVLPLINHCDLCASGPGSSTRVGCMLALSAANMGSNIEVLILILLTGEWAV